MFEEDTRANLRTCLQMAPVHCTACGDFHIWWSMRRIGGFADPHEWDGFLEGISRGIATAHAAGRRPAVLIAGAADTGILKSVVDAAYLAGGDEMVAAIDVTVADHCETPLQMCRDYAATYGVSVKTVRTDIGSYAEGQKFDVIAMHEVLPFFPAEQRLDYMRGIAGWLHPEGSIVSWSLVSQGRSSGHRSERYAASLLALDAFLAREAEPLGVDPQEMRMRLERGSNAKQGKRPFPQSGDVAAFHRAAGLDVVEELVIERAPRADGSYRECVVIVARPQG